MSRMKRLHGKIGAGMFDLSVTSPHRLGETTGTGAGVSHLHVNVIRKMYENRTMPERRDPGTIAGAGYYTPHVNTP